MPQNAEKAERLRDLRKNKKAMAQLLKSTADGLQIIAQGLQQAANTMEKDDE